MRRQMQVIQIGHLIQEIGYDGVERARGTKGRNGKERTVVAERTKGRNRCRRDNKKGIFTEIRKLRWSWAGNCALASGTALPKMLLLVVTLQLLDPRFPPKLQPYSNPSPV